MTVNGDSERVIARLLHQVDSLERAVATRADIGQAIGVIVATFRVEPDVAWTVLAGRSMLHNVKARDLAAGIVAAAACGDRVELRRLLDVDLMGDAEQAAGSA